MMERRKDGDIDEAMKRLSDKAMMRENTPQLDTLNS